MQQNFNQVFSGFPDTSRVWIYSSNRYLSFDEQDFINNQLLSFTKEWATHGKELVGAATIFNSNFVVFVVDESQVKASGCSIDTSVRLMKNIGNELKIDFFNRLSLLIENDESLERIHFNDLKNYSNAFIFDTTLTRLGDFRSRFKIKVSESPLFKMI